MKRTIQLSLLVALAALFLSPSPASAQYDGEECWYCQSRCDADLYRCQAEVSLRRYECQQAALDEHHLCLQDPGTTAAQCNAFLNSFWQDCNYWYQLDFGECLVMHYPCMHDCNAICYEAPEEPSGPE